MDCILQKVLILAPEGSNGRADVLGERAAADCGRGGGGEVPVITPLCGPPNSLIMVLTQLLWKAEQEGVGVHGNAHTGRGRGTW